MKTPLVSVVIPVYNIQDYISECIESVLSQSYSNIEIVIVNDGSTDNSGDIAESYVKTSANSRIRVVHQKNTGVSAARNKALDSVSGEYILFVDGDDVLHRDYVGTLVSGFNSSEVGMTVCGYARSVDELGEGGKIASVLDKECLITEVLYGSAIDSGPFCKMFRTEYLKDVRFDESVKVGEDFKLLLDLAFKVRGRVLFTGRKLYYYRRRPGSAMNSSYSKNYMSYLDVIEKSASMVLDRYPDAQSAVKYRLFGVASYCIGVMGRDYIKHKDDYNRCNRLLKKCGRSVLMDSRSSLKNRIMALSYCINTPFTSWLRCRLF